MASQQKNLSESVGKFNQLQNDLQSIVAARRQLESQLTENTVVKEELDLLDGEARVFKLIGPVLMKQPLKEAKDTVENRIKYLKEEIKRQEGLVKELEKKQEQQREQIRSIQQKMQATS